MSNESIVEAEIVDEDEQVDGGEPFVVRPAGSTGTTPKKLRFEDPWAQPHRTGAGREKDGPDPWKKLHAKHKPDADPSQQEFPDPWEAAKAAFEARDREAAGWQNTDEQDPWEQAERDADPAGDKFSQERLWTEGEEDDEEASLRRLRDRSRAAGDAYMRSIARANLLVPGFTTSVSGQRMDSMRKTHAQLLAYACMAPLRKGVSPRSVVATVGTFTAMTCLSENFRHAVGDQVGPLRDYLQHRADERTRAVRSRHGDSTDRLSHRWQARIEELGYRERGYRELHTPSSAAMTDIGLAENAFARMRQPDTDVAEVLQGYHQLRERLYQQIESDGLDPAHVAQVRADVLSRREATEPHLSEIFTREGTLGHWAEREVQTRGRSFFTPSYEDSAPSREQEDDFQYGA